MSSGHSLNHGVSSVSGLIEDHGQIDIRLWARMGFLKELHEFLWEVGPRPSNARALWVRTEPHVVALSDPTWGAVDAAPGFSQVLRVAYAPCNFGGQRPWFICPIPDCGSRAAILYFRNSFACRTCHRLVYESQRERETDRKIRKANKIRSKLGWLQGPLMPEGKRPKGMHGSTFLRLKTLHDHLARSALMDEVRRLRINLD